MLCGLSEEHLRWSFLINVDVGAMLAHLCRDVNRSPLVIRDLGF